MCKTCGCNTEKTMEQAITENNKNYGIKSVPAPPINANFCFKCQAFHTKDQQCLSKR